MAMRTRSVMSAVSLSVASGYGSRSAPFQHAFSRVRSTAICDYPRIVARRLDSRGFPRGGGGKTARVPGAAADDGEVPPVLEPRGRGPARALAARLEGRHPAVAFGAATVGGWIVLAALTVCLGLVLVHLLMPIHGLA